MRLPVPGWGLFGRAAGASLVCAAALMVPGADALADSIMVEAGPPFGSDAGPSSVELSDQVTLGEPAFVGVVLTEGSLASCQSDYAQALTTGRSFPVFGQSLPATAPPALAEDYGSLVLLPGGVWSLCGWTQPGGNVSPATASATSGPVRFTVGGPAGSTSLAVPASIGQNSPLHAVVSYRLTEASGAIEGSAGANLIVSAGKGAGSCGPGSPLRADGSGATAVTLAAPQDGSASFTGQLTPGVYSVCAAMVQTFPERSYGTLPGLLPGVQFATSMGTTVVLAHPRISGLAALTRRPGSAHTIRFRYSLNEAAKVAIEIARLRPVRHAAPGTRVCARRSGGGSAVCGVPDRVGAIHLSASAGANLTGRGARQGLGHLAPGVYMATAEAENAAHEVSSPARTTFTVSP